MRASEASEATAASADPWASVAQAYSAYAWEIETYVAGRFGGHVVAEDVVQEAFARLVREISAGREPLRVRPWLYRVAHNLAVSELRRAVRVEPSEGREDRPEPSVRSAESDYEAWALSPEIRSALSGLSRAGRLCILMAADGYSGRETAAAVGRSELATRVLLCRARRVLRKALPAGARTAAA